MIKHDENAVVPIQVHIQRRFIQNRQDSLAFLAEAFRKKLLQPVAERPPGRREHQGEFVAAVLRQRAQGGAQQKPGGAAAAGKEIRLLPVGDGHRVLEQFFNGNADQRRGNDAHQRQSRVASADVGVVGKNVRKL